MGDPVCWLDRTCPQCSLFLPQPTPDTCPRCGADLRDDEAGG